MPNDPPQIYLCAASQDHPFADRLSQWLRSRGLAVYKGGELGEPASPDERQRAMDASRLVLVVVSRAAARSVAVAADYHTAQAPSRPLIPLIVSSVGDLPGALSHVQAIDFTAGEQEGWAALLIALDTLGVARYPIASPPDLDAEVVLARARSGLTPPTWYVSRLPVRGRRRLSRWTIYGAAITLPLTVLGYFAAGRNLLVIIPALYILYQLYSKFSPTTERLQKNGQMVILMPDGFVVTTKTGGAVWAAFRDITTSVPLEAARTSDVHLKVNPGNGRPFVDMTLSKFPGEGMLGELALTLYRGYVRRYQAGDVASAPDNAPVAPLVFISYSRRDAAFVDRLELSLQRAGYNVWVDRSNLAGGQAWSANIQQAIESCAALVVVASPAALRSPAVRREYEYALKLDRPVLGALARTSFHIPPELRQRIASDHRDNMLLGVLNLVYALDHAGAHPLSTFGSLPGAHIGHTSTLAMAQALRGETTPGATVYQASLPARFSIAIAILLLVAAAGCWLTISSGDLYPLFIAGLLVFGVGAPTWLFLLRRLRYPDTIITFPEGYVTFYNSARLSEHPFNAMSALTIGPPSLWRGVTLVYTGVGSNQSYQTPIRPGFHQSRRIATEITANFSRYRSEISASLDHGAQT